MGNRGTWKRTLRAAFMAAVATSFALGGLGCKKDAGAGAAVDGASDASGEAGVVLCAAPDGGDSPLAEAITVPGTDEFGPNAPAAKMASSLGRVNVFEVTTPVQLQRVDIYLRAELPQTRLTIAVQEASSRTATFTKLTDVQLDIDACEGWASSGPLEIPLRVGRFYAIGFDPNQPVTAFVSTDGESLPTDGSFGRLIGSKTATSVSVPSIGWDKFLDKEHNRQRIVTIPRAPDPTPPDASVTDGADGGVAADAGDAARG